MEGFKHYRIGSFARYLCVTTSFLKHYEDEGLTSVVQQDNGYRRRQKEPEGYRLFLLGRMLSQDFHSRRLPLRICSSINKFFCSAKSSVYGKSRKLPALLRKRGNWVYDKKRNIEAKYNYRGKARHLLPNSLVLKMAEHEQRQ